MTPHPRLHAGRRSFLLPCLLLDSSPLLARCTRASQLRLGCATAHVRLHDRCSLAMRLYDRRSLASTYTRLDDGRSPRILLQLLQLLWLCMWLRMWLRPHLCVEIGREIGLEIEIRRPRVL